MGRSILHFPLRKHIPHPTLAIFNTEQRSALQTVLDALKKAGDREAYIRLDHTYAGKLEEIITLEEHEVEKRYSLVIPSEYATPTVIDTLADIDGVQAYPLDRLSARIAFFMGGAERHDNDTVHCEKGSAEDVYALVDRWRELGPEKMISLAAQSSREFAAKACGHESSSPLIHVALGIQTIDDKYLLDVDPFHGPFTCAKWGNRYFTVAHDTESNGAER